MLAATGIRYVERPGAATTNCKARIDKKANAVVINCAADASIKYKIERNSTGTKETSRKIYNSEKLAVQKEPTLLVKAQRIDFAASEANAQF